MSAKNVEQFFEKVAEDKALQTKLKVLHKETVKDVEKAKQAASAQVVKIAAAAGFKFTVKDLDKVRGAKKLSKTELAEVRGQEGGCDYSTYSYCVSENHTCIGRQWY